MNIFLDVKIFSGTWGESEGEEYSHYVDQQFGESIVDYVSNWESMPDRGNVLVLRFQINKSANTYDINEIADYIHGQLKLFGIKHEITVDVELGDRWIS